jgi:hypothetical protein
MQAERFARVVVTMTTAGMRTSRRATQSSTHQCCINIDSAMILMMRLINRLIAFQAFEGIKEIGN